MEKQYKSFELPSFKDAFLVLTIMDKKMVDGKTLEEDCASLSERWESCINSRYLMPDPGSVHVKFGCRASFNSESEVKVKVERGTKRKSELDEEEIELIQIAREVKKAKARKALA